MGGLFDDSLDDDYDDSLDDDDYVDDYDDENLEDSEDELGVDYHEVRIPQESISRSPDSEYLHPELTPPGGSGGSTKPYNSIAQAAVAVSASKSAAHKKKHKLKKVLASVKALTHKKKHHKAGYSKKLKVKKLSVKLKHKHGIKHVVLRHKNGKRTVFV